MKEACVMNPWIFFAIAIKLLSAAFDPEGAYAAKLPR